MNNFEVITGSFRWLSYDAYPIYTDRIGAIDNGINLSGDWRVWIKLFFMILFPAFLVGTGVMIIYRRQRK